MELRHLRYFVAVAEARSFVGAAERLHVAQPALSRQIKDLERVVGTELFVRDSRGVDLTPAGRACHLGAQRILRDADRALERARLAAQGLAGRCVISASRALLWNGLVARAVERVRNEFPGIDLAVEEQSLHQQWSALVACTTDIGLGGAPPADYPQLSFETHALDVLDSAVVSKRHRLAARETLTLEDLENEPFIHRDGEESLRMVRAEFVRRGFRPRSEQRAESLDSILLLVRAGAGWTIVPRSIRHHLATSAAVIPLEGFAIPAGYARIWRRGETRPVVRTVLSLLRRMSDEMQIGGPEASEAEAPVGNGNGHTADCPAARIELRHLRYFVAIVEEGSIGRAAERMGLTQPALSRQMRDLETAVGAPLIARETRGVTPTMAGNTLYEDAGRILASAERLPGEAQRAIRGSIGQCIIGIIASPLVEEVAGRVVRHAALQLPHLGISVVEVQTPQQAVALADARIDLGLGHTYPSTEEAPPIVKVAIAADLLDTALVAPGSRLARKADVSLAELADIPFLFMRRAFSPGFYDVVMSAFAQAGYRPRIEGEYDGLPTVWAFAAKNMGWCLASRSQRNEPPHGLVAIPLRDFEVDWNAHLVCREHESSPAVLEVRDLILHMAATSLLQA